MLVPTQPTGCPPERQEREVRPAEELNAARPEGDREDDRPEEKGEWQAYSLDVLTAFFDP
jgi:hypothetical protein